ncbi:MAG: hypothetical protein IPK83_08950 [Planctomycetes bacterium]|nr:hypothetical protein [Planctomycetota bacterium]
MTRWIAVLAGAASCSIFFAAPTATRAESLAIRGKTVYTMAGPPIKDGIILIRDGKIEKVGVSADIFPTDGYRVLEAEVVTPGLIDAHSVVGLTGYLNQRQDQEQLDHSEPMQPELRDRRL